MEVKDITLAEAEELIRGWEKAQLSSVVAVQLSEGLAIQFVGSLSEFKDGYHILEGKEFRIMLTFAPKCFTEFQVMQSETGIEALILLHPLDAGFLHLMIRNDDDIESLKALSKLIH